MITEFPAIVVEALEDVPNMCRNNNMQFVNDTGWSRRAKELQWYGKANAFRRIRHRLQFDSHTNGSFIAVQHYIEKYSLFPGLFLWGKKRMPFFPHGAKVIGGIAQALPMEGNKEDYVRHILECIDQASANTSIQ